MEKENKAGLAYQDYLNGMKYKDIASKYNVSLNTVKSWKQRKWTDLKKVCTQKQKSVHTKRTPKKKDKSPPKVELTEEEVKMLENEELTDKQRLFCLYYSKSFNATRAYQKAYECSYATALTNGAALLGNTRIKDEIMHLKKERCARSMLEQEDIFQKYMDIAFADITDYLTFGRDEVPVMGAFGPVMIDDPDTGKKVQLKKTVNVVSFRESDEVDGTLIGEVKQGRDGASIKLPDRMKALQWLSDHMGWATDEQKARIAHINAQTNKLKTESNDNEQNQLAKVDRILQEIQEDAKSKAG